MDRDLLANIRACENSRTGVERAAKRARRAHAVCSSLQSVLLSSRPVLRADDVGDCSAFSQHYTTAVHSLCRVACMDANSVA